MPKGKENVDKSKIEAVDKSAKKETKVDESNLVNKSETKTVKKIIEDKPSEEDEKNANNFNSYLEESGLPEAFQLIFSELVRNLELYLILYDTLHHYQLLLSGTYVGVGF